MDLLKIKRKGTSNAAAVQQVEANIPPLADGQLGISEAAALHIEGLLREKANDELLLRVAIRGGGCSGFSIHYEFVEMVRSDDSLFSKNGARVVIDKKSLAILGGATLHCRDYLGSKSFILVNNPSAKQCSCGQSFSL